MMDDFFDGVVHDSRVMFAYTRGDGFIHLASSLPVNTGGRVSALFRMPESLQASMFRERVISHRQSFGNDVAVVHMGSSSTSLHTLQQFMGGLYSSVVQRESKRNSDGSIDIIAHTHAFMSKLVDASNTTRTVLYVPDEHTGAHIEAIVTNWARQIRQASTLRVDESQNSGLSYFLWYWREREANLCELQAQLSSLNVRTILVKLRAQKNANYLCDECATYEKLIDYSVVVAKQTNSMIARVQSICETVNASCLENIEKVFPQLADDMNLAWAEVVNTADDDGYADALSEQYLLLMKSVANEIMSMCRAELKLENILHKESVSDEAYETAVSILRRAATVGENWKITYFERSSGASAAHLEGVSTMFSHIDAFTHRCKDLLEICGAQDQFAPTHGRAFPSSEGIVRYDFDRSLRVIRKAFVTVAIDGLNDAIRYDILDVSMMSWHEDFATFKSRVRMLEVKLCAFVTEAFDSAPDLTSRVELLQLLFANIARRDAIKRAVETHASHTYSMFADELHEVKRHFDVNRQNPPIQSEHSHAFGAVHWASKLLSRLENDFAVLRGAFADGELPHLPEIFELHSVYDMTVPQIESFINEKYQDWISTMSKMDVSDRLETNLLEINDDGFYDVSYAADVETACQDARGFVSMAREVPDHVRNIAFGSINTTHGELRGRLLELVDRHNVLLRGMHSDTHVSKIFARNVEILSSLFRSAAVTLSWNSPYKIIDEFYEEADNFCSFLAENVDHFKEARKALDAALDEFSNLSARRESDDASNANEFATEYERCTEVLRHECLSAREIVNNTLSKQRTIIGDVDVNESSSTWNDYVQDIESLVSRAMRKILLRSLSHMHSTLGQQEARDVPQKPLLIVTMDLSRCSSRTVEMTPAPSDIYELLNGTFEKVLDVFRCMPAGAVVLRDNSEIITKVRESVMKNATSVIDELLGCAKIWTDRYHHLWCPNEVDMSDSCIIGHEIRRFQESIEEVKSEENTHVVGFLRVECGHLKQSLIALSQQYIDNMVNSLQSKAVVEVEDVLQYFEKSIQRFGGSPVDIDELVTRCADLKRAQSNVESIALTFDKPRQSYEILNKFIDVPIDQSDRLEAIEDRFVSFKESLTQIESELRDVKDVFKSELQASIVELERDTREYTGKFERLAPLHVHPACTRDACDKALAYISLVDEELEVFDRRQGVITNGLVVFEQLSKPVLTELNDIVHDLEYLKSVWGIVSDWITMYEGWKDGKFEDLNVASMETHATVLYKQITKLGRGRIKSWGTWVSLKETVDSFKRIMPLIIDMRNPAVRPRHWELVMNECGQRFDPTSDEFTLDKVVELGLDNYAENISEISNDATKELSVENTLRNIANSWVDLTLDTGPFKDGREDIIKLRSAEEIFTCLEDQTVTLSTLKASKFFAVFEHTIIVWEKALTSVNDVIEVILKVQLAWMYLENIFVGSEDIARQLPSETEIFNNINTRFIKVMQKMHATRNVLMACASMRAPDISGDPDTTLLTQLTEMDSELELIQKSLDDYLESKRQIFPRFYFLSNDDLLQILGQAKEPENIQPHLKGMFEGIKRLEMHAPDPLIGRRHCESVAMCSPDGEIIPFDTPIRTEGRPEDWLNTVEAAMYSATRAHLASTFEQCRSKGVKKDKWVKDNPGQMLITAGCISWTMECERALRDPDNVKEALKKLRRKWIQYLNKLVELTRTSLDKVTRKKVTALITIEVHARDAIEKLIKNKCSSPSDFEWVSQLRFYWDRETRHCTVKQVLSVFDYGYEYQGNNGRLVVTPLTDRCYMTLGAAMFTRRGGNPLGPAGTGKTETVKDFGKALARYVIVFNCSDGVDYKMTGKMFSGLAQTGAWACLDEFNRITVEVLSVVATQISVVMAAVKQNLKSFDFEGQHIRLIPSCGVFVTMNPGYAGRAELPDNLKAIVRPVSMMVPDFCLIAEIMMFSEGFTNAKPLAKKMVAIMELSQQQLSKQDHYDYTLRSFIIPISRAAGTMKREAPETDEQLILFNAMRDLIIPKLVYIDIPLFKALLSDLFPDVNAPQEDSAILRDALIEECKLNNLQAVDAWISKIIQIFDCKCARHGNMIVGKTGSGKTRAWEILIKAMARLKRTQHGQNEQFQNVEVYPINPLALSNDELYGSFDEATHEWRDGVLAKIMRNVCKDDSANQKWILMDGPVDTLWIESMNTLLDDNKLLTLLSGERIMMSPQVSILFEVEDLSQASPATVSRAGMIYFNVEDLGWRPFVQSWLETRREHGSAEVLDAALRKCVDKYIGDTLDFRRSKCTELVPTDDLASVRQLTTLFDAHDIAVDIDDETDVIKHDVESTFVFCLIWSIGGSIDHASRLRFDNFLHRVVPLKMFPHTPAVATTDETVFDFFYDAARHVFVPWVQKVPTYRLPQGGVPFFKIMIPTVDSVRTKHLIMLLLKSGMNTLLVGNVGVGKSMVIDSCLEDLPDDYIGSRITFSAQTSSNSLQDTIEGKLEKRSKGVLAPPGGRKLILAIDDLNMPKKSEFGFIAPLELLKLWNDNGFWYDRAKQERTHINDMRLLAAMAPPGGGRNQFSQRIMSIFAVLNMADPSDAQLERIYGTIIGELQGGFDQSVVSIGGTIVKASVSVYNALVRELLPTPAKSHYLFNTRDLAKVIQGVTRATKQFYDSRESILQLWVHENLRVFGDRLWDANDARWLKQQIDTNMRIALGTSWNDLFKPVLSKDNVHAVRIIENEDFYECQPFVSFMRQGVDVVPYEAAVDASALKEFLDEKLEDYGLEPGNAPMDLVLFDDAIMHVCRIHRILTQPRGHAMLVGVGGSGRKSLARLAAYVAEMKCFSIEITKNYKHVEFREDLKTLYRQAGVAGKPTVFVLDDTQIVQETFLEDVNNALTSGEIPGLFGKDDMSSVCEDMRRIAKTEGVRAVTHEELFAFFMQRVMQNLHIVLCMSPVGDAFRERTRMFPGLVNCCTINWFNDWPVDALKEVAARKLQHSDIDALVKDNLCEIFGKIHASTVKTAAVMLKTIKRKMYVTPTNYIEFLSFYKKLMVEKKREFDAKVSKLRGGLTKLAETEIQVRDMQSVCKDKAIVVAEAKRDCEELLKIIIQDKRAVDEQSMKVSAEAERIEAEAGKANIIAEECQLKLDEAMPALQAAEAALNVLTKKDLGELKSYVKPPTLVELCLKGVLTVLKRPTTWEEAKKQLGDSAFLDRLLNFDKENLVDNLLSKISKFINNPDYQPDVIGKVSNAAKGLCQWVHAMFSYGNVAKEIAPKRMMLKQAQDELKQKQDALTITQTDLAEVLAKVQALKEKYEKSASNKSALESELADLELKLERAEALVDGLSGEKKRWLDSIEIIDDQTRCLPGDVCIAAAFMSYCGAFPSEYRKTLVSDWIPMLTCAQVPCTADFDFASFLSNPSDVRDWNIQGLPSDSFSTENGVIVTRGNRWPLLVDPQGQGNKWIKSMEMTNGLIVTTLFAPDMVRQIEHAIQFGIPVLVQDVKETIDPILENVVAKQFVKKGGAITVKLGDKDLDYSPNFRLYFTSKLMNPHYTPEVSTKLAVINFTVKEQGLNAQLRDLVVRRERPELATQKNELVVKVARGKRRLNELEDLILDLLSKASGSLLDNIELIDSLTRSKNTSEEVTASLKVAETTGVEIERASAAYASVATRATILYFTLYSLADVDPMYQFSLDSYTALFDSSITKSKRNANTSADGVDVDERLAVLNEYHTYAVYRYTSRGLFESHKLLLSLQMCIRIQAEQDGVDAREWEFFVRGDGGASARVPTNELERSVKVSQWLKPELWSKVVQLSQTFKDVFGATLIQSINEAHVGEWETWFRHPKPETQALPGHWSETLSDLQRLLLLRSIRLDRIESAIRLYVSEKLGARFVDPPVLDLNQVYLDSTSTAPCIFVLSAGVDPVANLKQLAVNKGMSDKLFTVALGQGQASVATELITRGRKEGHWVFLANCHLMISWLPELQCIIENFENDPPHENFRLWLSSNPTPAFPLAILQRGLKMTTEPPKGLRANLARLYTTCVSDESFAQCSSKNKYGRLLFALSFFHALLLERRKFGTLGLNIAYDFNDTDFSVSDDLLKSYLDGYEETPWDALRYLIGEANYGGRVTDEIDRRVIKAYLAQFFCEDVLASDEYSLTAGSLGKVYHIPLNATQLKSHREFVNGLPLSDQADAFGQHPNADISYLIAESQAILDACTKFQISDDDAAASGGSGNNAVSETETRVLNIIDEMTRCVPSVLDYEGITKNKRNDMSPLHVNLLQEIERYNALLISVHSSLGELRKGIKGLVVMSSDLDAIFDALAANKVPKLYLKAYPSLKPLSAWTIDLVERVQQLSTWAYGTYPSTYWLAGFTYPTCFLTSVLQTSARRECIPIDMLSFSFSIANADNIASPPDDGVYVRDMFLEGAGWDHENNCLCEPNMMELIVKMPVVHFKPTERKREKTGESARTYQCPLYMYPIRTGSRERPSFITMIELDAGGLGAEHWVKRGTALLLSLAI